MPLPTKNSAPPRELAPAGNHSAICIGHYHLGTQETPFGDKEQIILSFAIDEVRDDGSPHVLSTNALTLSLHEKAKLAQYIRTWIGKRFDENEEFDTASLVDRPCMVLVSHGTSAKGSSFAAIDSITALPKGMTPLKCDLSTFDYSPIDPTRPIPEQVPKWIAEKIQASREWVAYHGTANGNGHSAPAQQARPAAGLASVNPHPAKPPMAIAGYVGGLGLDWPYDDKDLDAALARAIERGENQQDLSEYELALRPFCLPF